MTANSGLVVPAIFVFVVHGVFGFGQIVLTGRSLEERGHSDMRSLAGAIPSVILAELG